MSIIEMFFFFLHLYAIECCIDGYNENIWADLQKQLAVTSEAPSNDRQQLDGRRKFQCLPLRLASDSERSLIGVVSPEQ